MLLLLSIFITFLSVISFRLFRTYSHKLRLTSKLPGPKGLPILGCSLMFANKTPLEFLASVTKLIEDYGNFWCIWLLDDIIFCTANPKDVEVILTSTKLATKSRDYDLFKVICTQSQVCNDFILGKICYLLPWLGTGLLISSGEKWFTRRKIITPTFHFKILDKFVEVFDKQSNVFVQKLEKFDGRGTFDVFPLVTLCALDVVCETAMGISINAQDSGNSSYVRAVREISDLIHQRTYNVIQRYDFTFQFTPTYQKYKKLLKTLHDFTDQVILERRQKLLESADNQSSIEDDLGQKKKFAFLDVLLQSNINGKSLSNCDIREEVDTFMFEGHDTTTSGIAFSLYNIAKHPEVQQKVIEEIRNVIGDDVTKPVKLSDLNELHYLEMVIKETMRTHPPVPMFGRIALEDTEINGKIIPKGSNIVIGAYFMGRDPEIWEDPEKFIPERFDTVKSADKFNPYNYIPFSAGQRNCIGQKFAMLEMKSTLSKVLRQYEISTPKDFKPIDVLEIITKSVNGVQLEIKKRV